MHHTFQPLQQYDNRITLNSNQLASYLSDSIPDFSEMNIRALSCWHVNKFYSGLMLKEFHYENDTFQLHSLL